MITDKNITICTIDIGSPRLGNIGWAIMDVNEETCLKGAEIDDLVPLLCARLKKNAVILGLEAPLFVPIREKLIDATKARKGEERRPWSAGAGAQVLTMNIPIMTYILREMQKHTPNMDVHVNAGHGFNFQPNQMMVFEALVSGVDKGSTHIDDAEIMTLYCQKELCAGALPNCIRGEEDNVKFLNLVAMSLLYCGLTDDVSLLHQSSPIYKPSNLAF